ncbi:redoxin domain-containing protein [Candidatus Entotheonella palauensis]|uniref:redoxin domain-containing protein n=1 Tax=Candidatus Entotheonella palauensis TaxID=93172 RepID=UPI002A4E11F8|nr:redoxin domain-containing protein [Candidatus Entotheonella palauensis]
MELYALQQLLPKFQAASASFVAITPELPDNTMTTVEKNELTFDVLSDVGNEVARKFGIVFELPDNLHAFYSNPRINLPVTQGNDKFELPVPATFVADRNGVVVMRHIDADYTTRVEPSEVLAAIQAL